MEHLSKPGDVDVIVWRVSLDVPNSTYAFCTRNIDTDERARADRFIYERDRRRFITAHAALRMVLGDTLGVGPLDIRFREGPRRRPLLATPETEPPLQFSLSHSDDGCLIGVARDTRIGVDIERRDPAVDCQRIADRFFTEHEATLVRNASEERRPKLFFGLWTRKEAYLKATGLGLHGSLTALQCNGADNGSLRIAGVEGSRAASCNWTLLDLDHDGFSACAIIAGRNQRSDIRTFAWDKIHP